MIVLDNFSVRKTNRPGFKLTGYVYDHPKFTDGSGICLSNPVSFDEETRILKTRSGTEYRLGKIDPRYAQIYDDAEARLFVALKAKVKENYDKYFFSSTEMA